MSYEITTYCNVSECAVRLGLKEPTGLAFLPRHFDTAQSFDDLVHESSVQTIRILFRSNSLIESNIENQDQRIPCIQENEFALILPTLFIGSFILSEHPHLVSIGLNILSNYCTDFFKGIPGRKKVKLEVVVENKTKKISKKIHYEGDVDGLKEIKGAIEKAFVDDNPN